MAKQPAIVKPASAKAEKIALAAIATEGEAAASKPPKAKAPAKAKPVVQEPVKEEATKPAAPVMQKLSQAELTKLTPAKKAVPITPTGKLDFTACETPTPGVGPSTPIDPNIAILSQFLKK